MIRIVLLQQLTHKNWPFYSRIAAIVYTSVYSSIKIYGQIDFFRIKPRFCKRTTLTILIIEIKYLVMIAISN